MNAGTVAYYVDEFQRMRDDTTPSLVKARKYLVKDIGVGIHGDAAEAAQEILARLQRADAAKPRCLQNRDSRLAELESQRKTWESELDQLSSQDLFQAVCDPGQS